MDYSDIRVQGYTASSTSTSTTQRGIPRHTDSYQASIGQQAPEPFPAEHPPGPPTRLRWFSGRDVGLRPSALSGWYAASGGVMGDPGEGKGAPPPVGRGGPKRAKEHGEVLT